MILTNFVASKIFTHKYNSMKITKFLAIAFTTAMAAGFTACSDSDDPVALDMVNISEITDFNSQNYWAKCYDISATTINADGFTFSHAAESNVWDGVEYKSWKGFCPSRVNDTKDHADNWIDNQWACNIENPDNAIFFVCNTNSVVSENPLDNTDCIIRKADGTTFAPFFIYVANSTYFYYAAKNGTAFQSAFTDKDWARLNIVGARGGIVTGKITVNLALGQRFLDIWAPVSLETLGEVDSIYFYFDSSQKNSYGITVPTYFCLSSLAYKI